MRCQNQKKEGRTLNLEDDDVGVINGAHWSNDDDHHDDMMVDLIDWSHSPSTPDSYGKEQSR